jgi:HTH-like domain
MSRAVSPISGKPYGLASVCRVWRLARSGVYRHQASPPDTPPARRGPMGPMSDAALTAEIRVVLGASPFHGEGHRKVWARLRFAGIRLSLRRVLRLMRENSLLAPGRVGSPRGPRSHDGTIIPDTVDTMWGTDVTATFTGGGQAAVFIAVDHFTAECVGIHASSRATRLEALEPIRQGVRRHIGGITKDIAHGLAVRHDHRSQYMSRVRPGIGRQCLAVHPHPEREPALGAALRDDRRTAPGFAGVQGHIQQHLADRTTRLHQPGGVPPDAASTGRKGRVGFNSVSRKPRAVLPIA